MRQSWFSVGAALVAIGVAAGALGAHALRPRLDAASLSLWETAVRYLIVAGFGLLVIGLAARLRPGRGWSASSWAIAIGGVIFSGTLGAIALGGPRWLGAVTPAGGLLLIAGFAAVAVLGFRH
ncbi:MAG: DUF423 domain-containing protein [Thermoanaerobaculales bacterium]